jgi:hypothetical protein
LKPKCGGSTSGNCAKAHRFGAGTEDGSCAPEEHAFFFIKPHANTDATKAMVKPDRRASPDDLFAPVAHLGVQGW